MFSFFKPSLYKKRAVAKLGPLVDRLNEELKEPFVIGGGCVRDLLTGQAPKDYDVFVGYEFGLPKTKLPSYVPPNANHYGELGDEVRQLAKFNGRPVELVTLKPEIEINSQAVCDRMDIAICRVSVDWQKNLYISPEAQSDFDNKTLTVLRLNSSRAYRVQYRLARLKQKFPKHVAVWANGLEPPAKPVHLKDMN